MKVIFIKDLKGQGKNGEIKDVKDGYATNFLIKNGYAVMYTKGSVERLNEENRVKEELDKQNILKNENIKKELENIEIKIKVKVGIKDQVFGSISTKQIASELEKLKYDIDKKKIKLDGEINTLGTHIVNIELYKNINAKVKIVLVKE